MMKTPVLIVTVALTVAILLAASLVIATGTRGDQSKAVLGEARPLGVAPRAAVTRLNAKIDLI